MSFVLIQTMTNHSTYILMHITINLVHVLCKMIFLLYTIARSLKVHRWIMPQLIRNFFVSFQHSVNFVQCCLVLSYIFTQTIKIYSALVTYHSNVFAVSLMLTNTDVEGPHFSRLLCSNVSSPLVGKKATNDVSDSESNNRNESLHSLLMNDGDIVDCLINLPCLPSRKKKDRRPTKCIKCFILTSDEQYKPRLSSHIYDSTV